MMKRRRTRRSTSRRKRTLTKKVKRVVESMAEKKCGGLNVNGAASTTDILNTTPLTDISDRTLFTQFQWNSREGQEVYVKSFNLMFQVNNEITTAGNPWRVLYYRVMVICARDLQGTNVPVGGTQMFTTVDNTLTSFDAIKNTMQCITYKIDRRLFQTISDKVWITGNNGNGVGTSIRKWTVKCNSKILFKGQLEGATNQNKRYFLLAWAYDPRQASAQCTVSSSFKTNFIDI